MALFVLTSVILVLLLSHYVGLAQRYAFSIENITSGVMPRVFELCRPVCYNAVCQKITFSKVNIGSVSRNSGAKFSIKLYHKKALNKSGKKQWKSYLTGIIGFLKLKDGRNGGDREHPVFMDYRPVSITSESPLINKVIISEDIELNGRAETNNRGSQHIQNKLQIQNNLEKSRKIIFDHHLLTKVNGRHQSLDEIKLVQGLNRRYLSLTGVDKGKEVQAMVQFQKNVEKNLPNKLRSQIQLQMNMDQRPNFGSTLASLWKREEDPSTESKKLEKDCQKTKEFNPYSITVTKLKTMLYPISDAVTKAKKKKIKRPQTITDNISKTKRSSSIDFKIGNSIKKELHKGLTSGYTKKPSGLGHIFANPTNDYPLQLKEASQPREQIQTGKHRGPNWLWRAFSVKDDPESREQSPHGSPSMGTEVARMWSYVDRVSKQWKDYEDVLPTSKESLSSEQTQTTHSGGSQSSEQTNTDGCQDKKRNDLQSVQLTPSLKHFHPLDMKIHTHHDLENQENGNIIEYIIRCKRGWTVNWDSPIVQGDSQLPPDRASPTRSQSPPRSPMNSKARSRTILASSIQSISPVADSSPPHQREQLRQLSNKEINDQYTAMVTRVKSYKQW